MFDTVKTASVIRNARIKKNLTQTNVADALGVSYQAVSNWERGSSMPDIGKLGELSDLLDISLGELLGHSRETETVKKVIEAEKLDDVELSMPEIADISPILPPDTAGNLAGRIKVSSLAELSAAAPFLSKEVMDTLAAGLKPESVEELSLIAPFVSRSVADSLAEGLKIQSIDDLLLIAPFVSKETLNKMMM